MPKVLWWGRFDAGYSRNRILRGLLTELSWQVSDFVPRLSVIGDIEAALRRLPRPDLVWVPCFRQRDLAASQRWARRQGVPLLADPLISAYDKLVNERRKFDATSRAAQRLLTWERRRLSAADLVLADTAAHAAYFRETFALDPRKLMVVPVGAEERLFQPCPAQISQPTLPLHVLFFGSYIPLQGPEVIVQAARLSAGADIVWTPIGDGPLRQRCEALAQGLPNVRFEPWIAYDELPARICAADAVLGIFGTTPKAAHVIPNKVYQALACGRPVITRAAPAYPDSLAPSAEAGLFGVPPGDPDALAHQVLALARSPSCLPIAGRQAYETYRQFFSKQIVRSALEQALASVCPAVHAQGTHSGCMA